MKCLLNILSLQGFLENKEFRGFKYILAFSKEYLFDIIDLLMKEWTLPSIRVLIVLLQKYDISIHKSLASR